MLMVKTLFLILALFPLLYRHGDCAEEVVQSGQPTHFHMEDRGPEIQVTADAEGVKINAKPAGLNVVAKPGHIPATIPHAHFVSTLEDIQHTPLERGHLHSIMQPASNSQLIHHGVEPVAYTAPIDGLAHVGESPHYINDNMPMMPVPFNYMDSWNAELSHFFGDHGHHHHSDHRHHMYHHYIHHHRHPHHDYYDDDDYDDYDDK